MANAITAVRIVCALALLFCPAFSVWFYLFYALGGISDVLDGAAARHTGKETAFGARLDTAADILFAVIVLWKVLRAVWLPPWMIAWIAGIGAVKAANLVCGFLRYRHLVSEHTVMNKVCGAVLFAIPFCIGQFPWQVGAVLMILTCAATTFAAVQEGVLIFHGKEIQ